VIYAKARLMDPDTEPLCVCGHMEGYHDPVSHRALLERGGRRVWYRACWGSRTSRKCRCPRFRLAIAQLSDVHGVEDAGIP